MVPDFMLIMENMFMPTAQPSLRLGEICVLPQNLNYQVRGLSGCQEPGSEVLDPLRP